MVVVVAASRMLNLELAELLLQRLNAAGITSPGVRHEAEEQAKKTNEHYVLFSHDYSLV